LQSEKAEEGSARIEFDLKDARKIYTDIVVEFELLNAHQVHGTFDAYFLINPQGGAVPT
jgi:hypothetical protein